MVAPEGVTLPPIALRARLQPAGHGGSDVVEVDEAVAVGVAGNLTKAAERLPGETARVVNYCLGANLSDLATG